MKLSELLTEATWIKGPMAVGDDGEYCRPLDEEACKWCLIGAMFRLKMAARAYVEIGELVKTYGFANISEFNDHADTTWGMVKGVIDNYESASAAHAA